MTTSSANGECSFLAVRAVNHLQHGVSSQTFKAQVPAGSWIDSLWLPNSDATADILESHITRKGNAQGKATALAVAVVDSVNIDSE
jgi:hypothetical protein